MEPRTIKIKINTEPLAAEIASYKAHIVYGLESGLLSDEEAMRLMKDVCRDAVTKITPDLLSEAE